MNEVTNTVHGGADVQDSEPLTLLQARDELRAMPAFLHPFADAIDAHMAKAGVPVAWMHDVVNGEGEPDKALSFSPDSFPLDDVLGFRSVSHEPLYAAPPSAEPAQSWPYGEGVYGPANAGVEPAQPVEAVDLTAFKRCVEALREMRIAFPDPDREVYRKATEALAQAGAALAHPRSTGDVWSVKVPAARVEEAILSMQGPDGEALDGTLWLGPLDDGTYGVHLSCDECPEEGSITLAVLPARTVEQAGEVEVRAWDKEHAERIRPSFEEWAKSKNFYMGRALPSISENGYSDRATDWAFRAWAFATLAKPRAVGVPEVVAYIDPDTLELHSASHIDWSRKNGVDVSYLEALVRMPVPVSAVDHYDQIDDTLLCGWAKAADAEIDGGDTPDDETGYAGYGATFTFDREQLSSFVRMVHSAQPRPVGVPDDLTDPGNPWRRAVEHAGYLVTQVDSYMKARGDAAIAFDQVEGADEPTDEQLAELKEANESAHEHWIGMRDGVYEFTKRRDRALATLAAAPAPGKGGEA
jgi:hypothetical protein